MLTVICCFKRDLNVILFLISFSSVPVHGAFGNTHQLVSQFFPLISEQNNSFFLFPVSPGNWPDSSSSFTVKEESGMKWRESQHVTISFTATKVLDWLNYLVKPHPLDLVIEVLAILRSYYLNSKKLITWERVMKWSLLLLLTVPDISYLFGFLWVVQQHF